jgi:hypothetical protein
MRKKSKLGEAKRVGKQYVMVAVHIIKKRSAGQKKTVQSTG